jgi:antitoxin ParD1/3/4
MQPNSISVELDAEIAAQVRRAVESGEYGSSAEVVEDALRDWSHHRSAAVFDLEGLGRAWDEARRDDSPGISADEVLDGLERKYQAMADAAASQR